MNLNEAAQYLLWQREQVKAAIEQGVELPSSKKLVRLTANKLNGDYDISEQDLDGFILQFDHEDPGRNPPMAVRRALLVEARHRCAICQDPSALEFHHIIEFSSLKHYDVQHMIVLCATCHTRCGKGEIDVSAQRIYKKNLTSDANDTDGFPARFSWDDLKVVITEVHRAMNISNPTTNSKYDRTVVAIEQKNTLNRMGKEYFETMRDQHQAYLGRIKEFLTNPVNRQVAELYYQLVDELNFKIAAERDKFGNFEEIFVQLYDSAKPRLNGQLRNLNIFLTFTYFECDVGRKT